MIEKQALWVFCEVQGGRVLPVSLQLLCKAQQLTEGTGRPVYAVVLGPLPRDGLQLLAAAGAQQVLHSDGPALAQPLEGPYARRLTRLVQQHQPDILLVGATPFGRAFAPRVAAALQTGLTADCTALELEAETGLLLQTRPAFGGNLMATIKTAGRRPQMATVRPGVFPTPQTVGGTAELIALPDDGLADAVRLLRQQTLEKQQDITSADIIVSAGRGIGQKKNLKLVQALAEKLGGVMGASRPLVDMGFCPYSCQIGQTGHTVAPRLLICCGISGAVQHLAGIGGAQTVVAINTDPKAPIFSVADYQITGDCIAVLRQLLEIL